MPVPHHLSPNDLAELASGHGNPTAIEALTQAWISRRKLLILAVDRELRAHPSLSQSADVISASIDLLDRVERHSPHVVSGPGGLFRHPYLAGWARHLITGLIPARDPAALASAVSYLATGALAAAARAHLDASLVLPAAPRATSVAVPGAGVLDDLPPGEALTSGQLAERIDQPEDHGSWLVSIDDTDPYRAVFGHAVADQLSPSSAGAWRKGLNEALTLIDEDFGEYAPSLRSGLETITPLRPPEGGGAISATAQEAHGAVACAPTEHPATLALLILHEFQHVKLYAVHSVQPLYIQDELTYYVPWREDRRSLGAALQGAYAHLAVADFWRRTRWRPDADPLAHRHFAQWRAATTPLIDELLLAESLTDQGRLFVEGMAAAAHGMDDDRVPPEHLRAAVNRLKDHRERFGPA